MEDGVTDDEEVREGGRSRQCGGTWREDEGSLREDGSEDVDSTLQISINEVPIVYFQDSRYIVLFISLYALNTIVGNSR